MESLPSHLFQRDWNQAVSMSIDSRWTIGAIASKKARLSSPVRARIASASGAAVSGPVAMMVRPQPSGGRPSTSSRSEEHTSELQPLMRNSYAVFCLKKNNNNKKNQRQNIEE